MNLLSPCSMLHTCQDVKQCCPQLLIIVAQTSESDSCCCHRGLLVVPCCQSGNGKPQLLLVAHWAHTVNHSQITQGSGWMMTGHGVISWCQRQGVNLQALATQQPVAIFLKATVLLVVVVARDMDSGRYTFVEFTKPREIESHMPLITCVSQSV